MGRCIVRFKGKVLLGILCAVLIVTLSLLIRTALAGASGDYTYSINAADTSATITEYIGSGTVEDPYQVSTPAQLNEVRNYPDACFIMTNDIDMAAATSEGGAYWNDGAGWEPIAELRGSFDGMGFEVQNLFCSYTITERAGVFATNDGNISNLGVTDVIIQSDGSAGGIVVENRGTISDCFTTGKVTGYKVSGGICAITSGDIIRCYNVACVSVYTRCDYAGGIAGGLRSGSHVECCYNTGDISIVRAGNISSVGGAGGIVGTTTGAEDFLIKDCFNTGSICVEDWSHDAGGISATLYDSELINCYNVGLVGGSRNNAGISAWVFSWSTVSGALYLDIGPTNLSGAFCTTDYTERAEKKTHEEMTTQATYEGYDFTDIWEMSGLDGYPYPVLKGVSTDGLCKKNEVFDGGTGLFADPYVISTAEQLNEIRNHNMKFFIISNDIDLGDATSKGGIFYNEGLGFDPIDGDGRDFYVHIDGMGHTISGLRISRPNETGVGLFGSLKDSSIKNLKLTDVLCTGMDNCGAIAGEIIGDIENCVVWGQVVGTYYETSGCGTGGIAGSLKGDIIDCVNYASVTGYNQCGGIAGIVYGNVIRSSNHSQVKGTWIVYAGGITGNINGTIMDCYNTANIIANKDKCSGGITGWNFSPEGSITFINCYSIGEAYYGITACSGTNTTGWSCCYYNSNKVKYSNEYGYPKSESELQQQITYIGFDFDSVWTMEGTSAYPYPELQFLPVPVTFCTAITITSENDTVTIPESLEMNAEVIPDNADDNSVTWTVQNHADNSDGEAAIDENGLLTGIKAGKVTVIATANDGSGVMASKEITVIKLVTVSAAANDAAFGSVTGDGTYAYGNTATLTAVPNAGYRFVCWKNGSTQVSTNSVYTFTVENSISVTAEFAQIGIPMVSAVSTGNNSVKITWTAVTGAAGYEVWRSTSASGTYAKIGTVEDTVYTESGLETGTAYYYKVKAYCTTNTVTTYGNLSAYATVQPSQYTVSAAVNSASYGSVMGDGTYNTGASVTLTATPNSGCRFVCWKDGTTQVSTSATYTFTATADVTLTAEFAPIGTSAVSAASAGYDRNRLSWSTVDGTAGYEVWRSTSSGGTYTKVGTSSGTAYTDTGLATGTTYYYKIKAYCTCSTATTYGSLSAYASATPVPAAPVSANAAAASYSSVQVSWDAVSGATGYYIYRATSASGTYSYIKSTAALSYTNTSLKTGTAYYYKVQPYRLVGSSKVFGDYSDIVSATPMLSSVATATATAYYPTKVKLTWGAVPGRTRYEVWRSEDGGPYTLIGTTYYTYYYNTGLTPFKTYSYFIKVYRTVGTQKVYAAESSPTASAIPILNDVTNVSASMYSATKIKITWSSVYGASGYEVLRWDETQGRYVLLASTTRRYYYNTSLIPNQSYSYKVRAYRTVGTVRVYSTACDPVSATPTFGSVTNPKAVRYNSTKIKLTWTGVSGRSGYEIYRATSADGEYVLIGSTTSTYYYSGGLTTSTPYYYKIRAYVVVNGARQYSDYSAVVTATP